MHRILFKNPIICGVALQTTDKDQPNSMNLTQHILFSFPALSSGTIYSKFWLLKNFSVRVQIPKMINTKTFFASLLPNFKQWASTLAWVDDIKKEFGLKPPCLPQARWLSGFYLSFAVLKRSLHWDPVVTVTFILAACNAHIRFTN